MLVAIPPTKIEIAPAISLLSFRSANARLLLFEGGPKAPTRRLEVAYFTRAANAKWQHRRRNLNFGSEIVTTSASAFIEKSSSYTGDVSTLRFSRDIRDFYFGRSHVFSAQKRKAEAAPVELEYWATHCVRTYALDFSGRNSHRVLAPRLCCIIFTRYRTLDISPYMRTSHPVYMTALVTFLILVWNRVKSRRRS